MRLEPRFVDHVARIIWMGGIVLGPGNVGPFATANTLNDVEAAAIVFAEFAAGGPHHGRAGRDPPTSASPTIAFDGSTTMARSGATSTGSPRSIGGMPTAAWNRTLQAFPSTISS